MPGHSIEHIHRAQVAALPVRLGPHGLEILLISSRETRRWIIPKGWPMKGRKDHDAAAREAMEEAGIVGRIRKRPIGAFTYDKRLATGFQPCRVMVYLLEVQKELTSWREKGQRQRQWFPVESAIEQVSEPGLARLMSRLDIHRNTVRPSEEPVLRDSRH